MSQVRWEYLASLLSVAVAIVAALGLMGGIVPERWQLAIDAAFRRSASRVMIDRRDSPLNTGRHLLFVRYELGYQFDNEFVYNGADLENGRIIWAHYFGPPQDRPVAQHFGNRQIWLLDAGERLNLQPYPSLGDAPP